MITVISGLMALLLSMIIVSKIGFRHWNIYIIIFLACSYSYVNMLFLRSLDLHTSPVNVIFVAVTIIVTILVGSYFTLRLFRSTSVVENSKEVIKPQNIEFKELAVIILTSIATITIVSKSSPLYVFNNWYDPNYFVTVARGMLKGVVPYRDLYEQKGPILYFIHVLAVLIDDTGFFGVYLIEIIASFLFLFYSYKLLRLFGNSDVIMFIPILSAIVYSSYSFDKGDSCEELCLWCIVYSLYIGFRIIKKDNSLRKIDYFFLGVLGAVILWTKYLMLGFFIGWILAILAYLISNNEIAKLCEIFLLAAFGVIICSIIVCSYFVVNGALGYLFEAYFYNNMFLYDPNGSGGILAIIIHLISGILKCIKNPFVSIMIVFGFLALKKLKKRYTVFYLCCLLCTMFFIYFKGSYRYYSFCLGAFAPVGIILLYNFVNQYVCNYTSKKTIYCGVLLISCIFFTFCPNLRYLSETEEDLAQFKFRDIILQEENPVLLSYDIMDCGFYNVCGIIPECKYFCSYNILKDFVLEEQLKYIRENRPEFIVTGTEASLPEYDLISTMDYYDRVLDITSEYYLYKKATYLKEK